MYTQLKERYGASRIEALLTQPESIRFAGPDGSIVKDLQLVPLNKRSLSSGMDVLVFYKDARALYDNVTVDHGAGLFWRKPTTISTNTGRAKWSGGRQVEYEPRTEGRKLNDVLFSEGRVFKVERLGNLKDAA